ncbi:FGGY-family carbohydrate kinase [Devosia sp.]|uniref:FGGY-family carbohydrate kinase n=1 Tax=Devosia sp. TaxID=1871048 RepID=UPI003A9314A5
MLPGLIALHQTRDRGRAPDLVAAVDVGTASARAAIVDANGDFLARADAPFAMHRPDGDIAEHDSEAIWAAVCLATREAMSRCRAAPDEITAISFDATCSLVVRAADGTPLPVSTTGEPALDTIAWMDHRAQAEAAEATATGHPVLAHTGGTFSPEMQVPKLMWLKRHLPGTWQRAGLIFDLVDFLCWRASGNPSRSICTLTCKWTYLPHQGGWQPDFLATVGLDDLMARAGLPDSPAAIGADLGPLTYDAATGLGLTETCRVAMGLIDAHAGALGAVDPSRAAAEGGQLTLVGGTSSCVMALSADPHPVPTVWGPFADAVLPGLWLNEAGQSATGGLLEYVLRTHSAGGAPTASRHAAVLARIAECRKAEGDAYARRLHLLPDFHGNRSPLGQPRALGVVSGATLDESFDALCRLYYRAATAIAMGLRHNLETLADHGYQTAEIHIAGGHTHNPLLMELYADVTGACLLEPATPDATLLGVAMVAATAVGHHADLPAAVSAMAPPTTVRRPNPALRTRHDHDYRIFHQMLAHRAALDALIAAD